MNLGMVRNVGKKYTARRDNSGIKKKKTTRGYKRMTEPTNFELQINCSVQPPMGGIDGLRNARC